MNSECVQLWATHYAPDEASAPLKLQLGHEAFLRIGDRDTLAVAVERLVENKLMPALGSLHQAIDTRVLPAVANAKTDMMAVYQASTASSTIQQAIASAKSDMMAAFQASTVSATIQNKLTAKGKVFENDLADMLRNSAAIASVNLLSERDSRNKQGGDLLVTDLQGNSAVIELKNKEKITAADLEKFVRDAEGWESDPPATCFVFLVKGGVTSYRKLQEKPLIEWTSNNRMMIWYQRDEESLVQQLPFMMALSARQAAAMPGRSADAERKAVSSAVTSLETCMTEVRKDLAALDKQRLALKKREQWLLESIQSLQVQETKFEHVEKKPKMTHV